MLRPYRRQGRGACRFLHVSCLILRKSGESALSPAPCSTMSPEAKTCPWTNSSNKLPTASGRPRASIKKPRSRWTVSCSCAKTRPSPLEACLYEPVLCLILQGEKQVSLGQQTLSFGPGRVPPGQPRPARALADHAGAVSGAGASGRPRHRAQALRRGRRLGARRGARSLGGDASRGPRAARRPAPLPRAGASRPPTPRCSAR